MNGSSEPLGKNDDSQPGFVYFDLDDTLLDHRAAERAALRDLACEVLALEEDSPLIGRIQQVYHTRNRELWADYAAGRISKGDLRKRRFQPIAKSFGDGRSWKELDTFYMARYADHWRPVDGALEVFEAVSRRYPVGIITNGFADTQRSKLERFPAIRGASGALIISEEVGHLKPDPRLFAVAEERAEVPGELILYVGDSLHSDVRGALDAGWRAAWYTREEAPDGLSGGVFVFGSWPDLAKYLGS